MLFNKNHFNFIYISKGLTYWKTLVFKRFNERHHDLGDRYVIKKVDFKLFHILIINLVPPEKKKPNRYYSINIDL